MHVAAEARPRRVSTRVTADRRFKGYKPESAKAVRMPEVKEDATLRQLRDAWGRFVYDGRVKIERNYPKAVKAIDGLKYTAKDIEAFSVVLAEFQDETLFGLRSGLFLSALINNCADSKFVFHTRHLDTKPQGIGFQNTKHITVEGDVGSDVGWNMKGGYILVKGNAGEGIGGDMESGTLVIEEDAGSRAGFRMKGGELIVKKNVSWSCGQLMCGGSIVVFGDATTGVGSSMKGGTITMKGNAGRGVGIHMHMGKIFLEGDFESLSKNIGGYWPEAGDQIFHKGRLIVRNGKVLDPSIPQTYA